MTMTIAAPQLRDAEAPRRWAPARPASTGAAPSPSHNHLLAALPGSDYVRLVKMMEPVPLPRGKIVHEAGSRLQSVYFPVAGIVSVMSLTEAGDTMEVAAVGNDGLVGIGVFMGDALTTSRALVRSAGYAYKLPAVVLKREFDRGGALHMLLLRYTLAFITHAGQAVGCTRYHAVDQRLCRCLLSSLDRLATNELRITQEVIASALGVRREAVTMAAKRLQAAGVIDYSRGHIAVLDRHNLETRACACYASVKKAVARLMMMPPDAGRMSSAGARTH